MSEKRKPERIDGVEYWRCAKCDGMKLFIEFHRCSAAPAGIYSYCKVCQNGIVAKRYRKTKRRGARAK